MLRFREIARSLPSLSGPPRVRRLGPPRRLCAPATSATSVDARRPNVRDTAVFSRAESTAEGPRRRDGRPACGPTVDSAETDKFSAFASRWWEPHGPARLLHLMNPTRLRFIERCRAQGKGSAEAAPALLDVGCGGGIFAESAARYFRGGHVTGIDPTPGLVATARLHARCDPALVGRLDYMEATAEEMARDPARRGAYDLVSVFEVVEHAPSPAGLLAAAGQLVRPGGWIVGSTIARSWTSWLTTKFFAEYALGLVPLGTHDWYKFVDARNISSYFENMESTWGEAVTMGVIYVPGIENGWQEAPTWVGNRGNYFFGLRKMSEK